MQQEVKSNIYIYVCVGEEDQIMGVVWSARDNLGRLRGILICFHLGKAAMHTQMDAKFAS
jgi:hypothetical protein